MRGCLSFGVAALGALALCDVGPLQAQEAPRNAPPVRRQSAQANRSTSLNNHDRSSVITAALRSKRPRHAGRDCSHLVHSIYQRAGFPYPYADSEDLYDGAEGFRRVSHPKPADLVVWHGHVGIVIRPSGHEFFSLLSTGPGIDDYQSRYWKGRGQPRFYRYVKHES